MMIKVLHYISAFININRGHFVVILSFAPVYIFKKISGLQKSERLRLTLNLA